MSLQVITARRLVVAVAVPALVAAMATGTASALTVRPSVTSVSATAGADEGGAVVTVRGSGFSHVHTVHFGAVLAGHLHVLSAHTLTVVDPAHSAALVNVTVRTVGGTSAVTAHDRFRYEAKTEWSWGFNNESQLGIVGSGGAGGQVPAQVSALSNVTSIAAGDRSGYATTLGGQAWSWGGNVEGQLGRPGHGFANSAPRLLPLTHVRSVAGSDTNGYAVRTDGSAYAWGDDSSGQLGIGQSSGQRQLPVLIPGLGNVVQLAGGSGTSYALESDGTVWVAGWGGYGELGNGTSGNTAESDTFVPVPGLSGITSITASSDTAFALAANGTVWAWGSGFSGALGNGDLSGATALVPVQVSGLAGVVAIAGHGDLDGAYALKSDGTVWAWGENSSGQLGNGGILSQFVPVQVHGLTDIKHIAGGSDSAIAVRSDGSVYAWGDNIYGELGNHSSVSHSGVPVRVGVLTHVTAVADFGSTGYAIRS
jgi:alpha-tubulin suppressor-like RCC1 family protein